MSSLSQFFFDDISSVNEKLGILKANNIKLSLDDFGTGYSSFSYLKDLNIDYLKIDKSFIQAMSENPKSLAIVRSIVELGKNLDLTVIAEGVETINDKNILLKTGCHIAQGYLYSRAKSPQEIYELYNPRN